jgi:DNA-binding HxlR family transcriptional regulator
VVLLAHLETGAKRFGQLRDSTDGISEKMLTQTLRSLERDGLIARRVHPGVASQVEYRLTTLGRSLLDPLAIVRSWAQRHTAEIERARLDYDEADRSRTPGCRSGHSLHDESSGAGLDADKRDASVGAGGVVEASVCPRIPPKDGSDTIADMLFGVARRLIRWAMLSGDDYRDGIAPHTDW